MIVMCKEDLYIKYGVDVSKLKRDYIKYPLNKISRDNGGLKYERPILDDIIYFYNECHLCLKFISDILGVSKFVLVNWFNEFNINRNDKELSKLIREKTNLVLYGYTNYSKSDKCRKKVKQTKLERYGDENYTNREKALKTNFERYGVKYPQTLETIKIKQKSTNIEKYGCEYFSQTNEYKEKVKQTCLEKYGVENVLQNKEIHEKQKQTNLKKYGYENPSYTEEIKNKISIKNKELSRCANEKRKQTCLEKYGVSNYMYYQQSNGDWNTLKDKDKLEQYIKDNNVINCSQLADMLKISVTVVCKTIKEYDLSHLLDYTGSMPEKEIRDYVNQYYETENNTKKYLDGKEIDIYIPSLKIGIEFNGDFWHNEYGKEKSYHQNKSLLAEQNGIFLYHIFEYEWNNNKDRVINQLNNLLGINQEKIYARKCIIKEVDNNDKSNFLELNHMQGDDSSSIKLGLYYNDELVSLMTFVKPRFNKKYQYELSRFCSKANCNVVGGASKLWKYFIDNYMPESVISYSNIAHTKGNLYGFLGFKLEGISDPNYVWSNGCNILTRYQCQKHKLLEQGFEGNSETDIMHNLDYFRIFDCGNKVWIWKKGSI